MFDKGFGPEVRAVLQPLRSKASPAQAVLVLATLPKALKKLVDEEFPGMEVVRTESLHKGIPGARHSFMPVPADADKLQLLSQAVEGDQRRGKHVMVFCNTLASCRATEHHLAERGVPTVCYHGDVPLDGRRQALAQFSATADPPSSQPVLVCTDLAARGLDIPGRVDHVVNFDFPFNPVDYLHRTGRTARAGASGKITSLVSKKDRVLASRIEQALSAGMPLDELSSSKAVLPPNMRPRPDTVKRKVKEAQEERNSRRGVRGAMRFGAPKAGVPGKKRSGTSLGKGRPESGLGVEAEKGRPSTRRTKI
eukprot:jgi/Botrbrau1/11160/Bobra.182_2s0015.1